MFHSVALAFLPGAHPTYIPLGVASLFGYLKKGGALTRLSAYDLSISLWHSLMGHSPKLTKLSLYFRGLEGDFFDRSEFETAQEDLQQFYVSRQRLEEDLKVYLLGGPLSDAALLHFCNLHLKELAGNELVALSLLYSGQLVYLFSISKYLKELNPAIQIIAGGAALSALSVDEILDAAPWVDMLFRGEGETGLLQIINGEERAGIRGLSYRSGQRYIHNKPPSSVPLESLPIPDFSFTDLSLYFTPEPVLPVIFSRGCKWRQCRFCSHNFSFAGYRTSQHECFVSTLLHYQTNFGVKHFYIVDQYIDADDLKAIAEELIRRKAFLNWHVMGRPTADYTFEVLTLLRQAGCRWISWGVESFSQELLNICKKGTEVEVVKTVLQNTYRAGISNLAMMIFGLPGSNDAAFQKTLDVATLLSPCIDAFTSSSFLLFTGTPFFKHRHKLGMVECADSEKLCQTMSGAVKDNCVSYAVVDSKGQSNSPPGSKEVEKWNSWKLWVRGGPTFFEGLLSEYYLLYCANENRIPLEEPIIPDDFRPKGKPGGSGRRYKKAS